MYNFPCTVCNSQHLFEGLTNSYNKAHKSRHIFHLWSIQNGLEFSASANFGDARICPAFSSDVASKYKCALLPYKIEDILFVKFHLLFFSAISASIGLNKSESGLVVIGIQRVHTQNGCAVKYGV